MPIELKRVTEDDLEKLITWRMDSHITRMLFNDVKLTMKGQLKWFEKLKKSDKEIRWIIWKDGIPAGSMYLVDIDRNNKRCETGGFIHERQLFQFSDVIDIQYNITEYAFEILQLNRLYGYIMDDNLGNVRLSKMYGYDVEGVMKKHILKNDKFHDVYIIGLTKDDWETKKQNRNYKKMFVE